MEGSTTCVGHRGTEREAERLVRTVENYLERLGVGEDDREAFVAAVNELARSRPRIATLRRVANNLGLAAV